MQNAHQNARLTLHSREQIIARLFAGQSAAEVAAAFAVSVRTVRKRLANVEVPAKGRRHTTAGFLLRALRWSLARDIRAERVMSDIGTAYRSRLRQGEAASGHLPHLHATLHAKDLRQGR
jgi:DNA-binding CsgD family transcriptional regulator